MNFNIDYLKQRLKLELPGEAAHSAMSPVGRGNSSEAIKYAKNMRKSAVAIVLYTDQNSLSSVLIQRPTYEGVHSGQVCLPGGKKEDFEQYLHETAIRECVEETGLIAEHLELLAPLTPVYIPPSNHHVHPYIFHYHEKPIFFPDEREVAEIIQFSLNHIIDEARIKRIDLEIGQNKTLKNVPYFDIEGRVVWGATAIILNELRTLLLR
jgi:8-oxo-dGTP pyrophosphatase MutT (NUDIX family)